MVSFKIVVDICCGCCFVVGLGVFIVVYYRFFKFIFVFVNFFVLKGVMEFGEKLVF